MSMERSNLAAALLADDVGLGKTIQALSLIELSVENIYTTPHLLRIRPAQLDNLEPERSAFIEQHLMSICNQIRASGDYCPTYFNELEILR